MKTEQEINEKIKKLNLEKMKLRENERGFKVNDGVKYNDKIWLVTKHNKNTIVIETLSGGMACYVKLENLKHLEKVELTDNIILKYGLDILMKEAK